MEERYDKYRELFVGQLHPGILSDIRDSTQKGLVLGTDAFKEQMAELLGREIRHRPRGRPRKIGSDPF